MNHLTNNKMHQHTKESEKTTVTIFEYQRMEKDNGLEEEEY